MLKCKRCGAAVDVTMGACPACGTEVALGRITGLLGIVCPSCDAYNDPGTKVCIACDRPFGLSAGGAAAGAPLPARPHATRAAPREAPVQPSPAIAAAEPAGHRAPPPRAPTPPPPHPRPVRFTPPPSTPQPVAHAVPHPVPQPAPQPVAQPAPAPAPSPASAARLVVERGEAAPGTAFEVGAGELQAGRAQGQLAFPDDPCLAPLHATFFIRDGALVLRDEGAAGGVFVRLRGLTIPMRPGGLFAVGNRLLRFAGPLAPAPPPPTDGTRRVGSPRPDRTAVVVEEWLEGGIGGRTYVRVGPSITIGRTGCAINLGDDPQLSQAHAELLIEPDGSAKLRDLASASGTFVRIPPGGDRELHDGDGVRLGREVLRVELG